MAETFRWEEDYTEGINIRTVLQEDELGSVENAVQQLVMVEKKQRRMARRPANIRLGMIRYVYIGLDLSGSMISSKYGTSKLQTALLNFMNKFFELNPLSSMGIISGHEKRAEKLCSLTSSIQLLKESLLNIKESSCIGEFSLHSILDSALQSFQNIPIHSSKECILIIFSLSTVDAVNLKNICEQLKMRSIRCSVIAFSAEVFAFKKLCITTQGKYSVVLDDEHLAMLFDEHIQPPPVRREQGQQDNIVRMGFPQRRRALIPSFCACHDLYDESVTHSVEAGGILRSFFCPQCGARYCQTPVQCRICGLLLLTAPQLARAHQHMEPLQTFVESVPSEKNAHCFACDEHIPATTKSYKCGKCGAEFCIDCDILLHESLQICSSCG